MLCLLNTCQESEVVEFDIRILYSHYNHKLHNRPHLHQVEQHGVPEKTIQSSSCAAVQPRPVQEERYQQEQEVQPQPLKPVGQPAQLRT